MPTRRARSAEAKDARRAQLVDAASRLFADADFEAITIARVAEVAGMAKGTAYLYFATKEALFLELVRAELTQWLAALIDAIDRQASAALKKPTLAEFVIPRLLAESFVARPQVRRLLVLQHTVLEPNLDDATAREFKLHMRELMDQATAAIASCLPDWREQDAQVFVMQTLALVIGGALLAEPAPVICRVLASDPKLKPMQIDFGPFLERALVALVQGRLT